MPAVKAIIMGAVILFVLVTGLFIFVPDARPGIVEGWFMAARGYSPAKTPEEALEKFKKAMEHRDYKAAARFCTGDFKEVLEKYKKDASALGQAIDDLRFAMKVHGLKSDQGEAVLFLLEPFPSGFKIINVSKGDTQASAALSWEEELRRLGPHISATGDWQVQNVLHHSLLSVRIIPPVIGIPVSVKLDPDKAWRVDVPVAIPGGRALAPSLDYLTKNGSNFTNALTDLKYEVKNNPGTKESFESALRAKLRESR